MRFLIAGGTGLLGRSFIRQLSDEHEIIVLTRNPKKKTFVDQENVRLVKWDGKTPEESWTQEIQDDTVVINFVGENIGTKRWTKKRKKRIEESRVLGTRVLAQAVADSNADIRVFVQASAIGIYGDTGDTMVSEGAPPGNDFLAQLTVKWEEQLKYLPENTRVVIPRFGIILSKEEGALPQLVMPLKLFVGGPFGSGKQWMSWMSIHDLVRGLNFLITNNATQGPYNFISPNPMRNKEFIKTLGKYFHRPAIFPIPYFFLRLLIGEFADTVYKSQRVQPRRLLEAGFEFKYPTLLEALKGIYEEPPTEKF